MNAKEIGMDNQSRGGDPCPAMVLRETEFKKGRHIIEGAGSALLRRTGTSEPEGKKKRGGRAYQ